MKKIVDEIREYYYVDGECKQNRYLEYYETIDDVLEIFSAKDFEEKFRLNVRLDELHFPIITFDFSGSSDGWLFDSTADKYSIMYRANEYFEHEIMG